MNARLSPRRATIVTPEQSLLIKLFVMNANVLFTTETTGGAVLAVLGHLDPGDGPANHVHFKQDEMFYVLEGTFEFATGDQIATAGPGTIIFVPRTVVHRFRNVGTSRARLLVWSLPGGLDHHFRAISDLAAGDAFTREQAMEMLADRLGDDR
jgi:mannose-6-phosphate isomerase-like protein (cupin superfamily)